MNVLGSITPNRPLRAGAKLVGGCALLGFAIGILAAATSSEKWLINAKVMLQIGPETAGSRPSMVGSPAPFLAGNPRREDVQTEVELLSSSDLLRRAFERLCQEDRETAVGKPRGLVSALLVGTAELLGLLPQRTDEQRALDKWASSLRIAAIPSSTMFVLECRSERPEAAQRLLSYMLDCYMEDHQRAFGGRGMAPILQTFLADREGALARTEAALTATRTRLSVIDVVTEVEQLETRRTAAESTAQRLEGELASAKARITLLSKLLADTPNELRQSTEQRANPTRDALELRSASAQEQLATARQMYLDDSPEVRQAQQLVQLLQGLVEAALPVRQDGVITGRDPLHDSLRDLQAKATAESVGLAAQLQVARKDVQDLQQRLLALEAGRAALQKCELDVAEAKRDLVQAREGLRLAQIEQVLDRHQIANVTVVTPPNFLPTPMRSFGLPARVAVLLGCIVFFASAGVALWLWRRAGQQGEVQATS
jgi:uncharacterized protein involved in exopolysaccharide biosynthesis